MTRIPYVDLERLNPLQRTLIDMCRPSPNQPTEVDWWALMVANHPRLAIHWNVLGSFLLFEGSLPDVDRELLTLRAAFNAKGQHAWSTHVRYGSRCGLSDAEMEGAAEGADSRKLDAWQRILVEAADDLDRDGCISDGVWAKLAERYTHKQLIEVCVVVGSYTMSAFVMNSCGVGPDGPALGLVSS
jgi:4-carboxymuconolactone decarboxylase